MELRSKNILIISPTAWDVSFPARQHYARELAKIGNVVFFLNPFSKENAVTEFSRNLYIVDLKPITYLFGLIQANSEQNQIDNIYKLIQRKIDLIWSFDQNRFTDYELFGKEIPKILSLEEEIYNESQIIKIANTVNLCIGMSLPLLEKVKASTSSKVLFHHALSNAHTEAIQKLDLIMANTQFATGRIRCGYLGNLQNKYIDTVTFEKIIKENPIVEFHLIGPFVKDSNLAESGAKTWEDPFIEFLMSSPNVRLYGSLMTVRAAEILQTMDMFLVCYDTSQYLNQVANPAKIIEYLSSGHVVVASKTLQFQDQKELVATVEENDDLPRLFQEVSQSLSDWNREDLKLRRQQFALNRTYEKQILRIEKLL
jgi:hypothetical protein